MRGINRYKTSKVHNASKEQLVTMLFQEAVKRLHRCENKATEFFSQEQIKDLAHVREIYTELLLALDPESAPELVERLGPLYRWCLTSLIKAGSEHDTAQVEQVRKISETLLDGWVKAVESPERQSA